NARVVGALVRRQRLRRVRVGAKREFGDGLRRLSETHARQSVRPKIARVDRLAVAGNTQSRGNAALLLIAQWHLAPLAEIPVGELENVQHFVTAARGDQLLAALRESQPIE